MNSSSFKNTRFTQYLPVTELFDCLTDTVFFVKDAHGRYQMANTTFTARCKLENTHEVIGKRPTDLFGDALGQRYEAQDRDVMEAQAPIIGRLELHIYPDRNVGWCVTNKFPLRDEAGDVIGVTGVSRDLGSPQTENADYDGIQSVLEHVRDNLSSPPHVRALSAIAGLTPYQLDRRIRKIFGLSTGRWVLRQRLELARMQLVQTDKDIAEIAMDSGYFDQSAFSRQFLKTTGLSPSAFRKAYGNRG